MSTCNCCGGPVLTAQHCSVCKDGWRTIAYESPKELAQLKQDLFFAQRDRDLARKERNHFQGERDRLRNMLSPNKAYAAISYVKAEIQNRKIVELEDELESLRYAQPDRMRRFVEAFGGIVAEMAMRQVKDMLDKTKYLNEVTVNMSFTVPKEFSAGTGCEQQVEYTQLEKFKWNFTPNEREP